MKYINTTSGTVLVYTMVLVVLGVFMATVVLNVATELSAEYDRRNIEISIINIIETKGDLAMKYSRELNTSGSGFTDVVSCPDNIVMSGSTVLDGDVDTEIRYIAGSIVCRGVHDNGSELIFSFNSAKDDLQLVEYQGVQVTINSSTLSGTFGDADTTTITLPGAGYLSSDGIDDDFDSDNYSISSDGSTYYPDNYIDNDALARTASYGYVLEQTGLYNVFWSNSRMKNYINDNTSNSDTIYENISNVSGGYLHLDINTDHRVVLFRINSATYDESSELIVEEHITGTGQLAAIGYLQNDLSLALTTADAYNFDFINNDYALFVENTSSGALLYQVTGEVASTGSGIYLSPLNDVDTSLFSFLGSHMLVDDEGRLIGDQFEVFGLK